MHRFTTYICNKFSSNNNIETLHWPSRSSDLNIMEILWIILIGSVYENGSQFSSKEESKNVILFSKFFFLFLLFLFILIFYNFKLMKIIMLLNLKIQFVSYNIPLTMKFNHTRQMHLNDITTI